MCVTVCGVAASYEFGRRLDSRLASLSCARVQLYIHAYESKPGEPSVWLRPSSGAFLRPNGIRVIPKMLTKGANSGANMSDC